MAGLDSKAHQAQDSFAADHQDLDHSHGSNSGQKSKGSSVLESELNNSLDQSLGNASSAQKASSQSKSSSDDHDHAPVTNGQSTHVSLEGLEPVKSFNSSQVAKVKTAKDLVNQVGGDLGDLLNPGGGKNTVTSARRNDIVFGDGGGFNTITTGEGKDAIVLGKETTNRIFDFDPTKDKFILSSGLKMEDILITQGKNPGKGGLDQPTDSENNALIIDKNGGHILGALTFTKAAALSANNFAQIDDKSIVDFVKNDAGFASANGLATQQGNGQINGTTRDDKLVGGAGDDFLYLGDDSFSVTPVKATSGANEFPFKNDSPGTTDLKAELKAGVLRIDGTYQNFDGAPLFSQGETVIDPKATILNGSDPVALINGFLKVPQDVEGNKISGTHLHFSPSGDDRGNFADATVVRYLTNTPTDAKSGTITGEFELTPEEQAAFLAGNLYTNLHTNVDTDGDGKAGFPTGENRVNFNKNDIQFDT
ncbi:MAG TPA: CHRD domain-containing protein [Coleofasciculaceae cyanobacterium]|jgi:hypothetical protein